MNVLGVILNLCAIFWTVGQAAGHVCNNDQYENKGLCCNKCPKGTYLKEYCNGTSQTFCVPCQPGFFSEKTHKFDRCEKCQTCKYGYSENCTSTTRGTCMCKPGLLCSEKTCSTCIKNPCKIWENPKKNSSSKPSEFSYYCEPKCSEDQYFDANENTCKQRNQCKEPGSAVKSPGNETHNQVCHSPGEQKIFYLNLSIGLVSFVLFLLIFASLTYFMYQRKCKSKPPRQPATSTNEFHLSKEESGIQFIKRDIFKDNEHLSLQISEKLFFLND